MTLYGQPYTLNGKEGQEKTQVEISVPFSSARVTQEDMMTTNSRISRLGLFLLIALVLTLGGALAVGAQEDDNTGRPLLGVRLQDTPDGITIVSILPESPAAAVDIQVDDIVTAINGSALDDARAAVEIIRGLNPGDVVTLDLTRTNEPLTVEVMLGELRDPLHGGRGMMGMGLVYDEQAGTLTLSELSENNPLYAAGLRSGDVITAVNGQPLTPETMLSLLRNGEMETLTLTVQRGSETLDLEVDAAALAMMGMMGMDDMPFGPGRGPMIVPGDMVLGMPLNGFLGVGFESLTAELAAEEGLSVTDGALIREVVEESPAATVGLQAGDVVTAVNSEAVDAEWSLRDRLAAYEPEDVVTLTVLRAGETLTLEVTLAEPADMMELFPGRGGRGVPGGPNNPPLPVAPIGSGGSA
jgi:S1-C subfamily serine protease